MTGYPEKVKEIKEEAEQIKEQIEEDVDALLEKYFEDEEREILEETELDEEENKQMAKRWYRINAESQVKRNEAKNPEEHLVPADDSLKGISQDLEISITHLKNVEPIIEDYSEISEQLRGLSYAFDPEVMYYDFMRSVQEITGDIAEDFKNAGGEEIWGWGPNMEGGPNKKYVKMYDILEVEHEVEEGENTREEVEWDADEFEDLEREHFEAIKNIAHELEGTRKELNTELLTASIRLKDAIQKIEEALEHIEDSEDEEKESELRQLRQEAEDLRENLKESLEIYNERLQRAYAYIDDFIDGNSKEIERILDGGMWKTKEDGMWAMKWHTPERYEDDEE